MNRKMWGGPVPIITTHRGDLQVLSRQKGVSGLSFPNTGELSTILLTDAKLISTPLSLLLSSASQPVRHALLGRTTLCRIRLSDYIMIHNKITVMK